MMKPAIVAAVAFSVMMTLLTPARVAAQQQAPTATAEETRIYEEFRAWISSQSRDLQQADDGESFDDIPHFCKPRASQRLKRVEDSRTAGIGDRAEVERWNRILTSPNATFNKAPNAFLADMVKGLKPGRALDVGMGQGRNTIFLAQQGWEAVGFDPADRAIAVAQQQASRLGVKITTRVARAEDFDWGTAQWDLIVLSYVGGREYVSNVVRSLRPGGLVLIEGFHRDATKTQPIGGAVVFDTNELLTLYNTLRVVRYEDTEGVADFGLQKVRVVRLLAQKP